MVWGPERGWGGAGGKQAWGGLVLASGLGRRSSAGSEGPGGLCPHSVANPLQEAASLQVWSKVGFLLCPSPFPTFLCLSSVTVWIQAGPRVPQGLQAVRHRWQRHGAGPEEFLNRKWREYPSLPWHLTPLTAVSPGTPGKDQGCCCGCGSRSRTWHGRAGRQQREGIKACCLSWPLSHQERTHTARIRNLRPSWVP